MSSAILNKFPALKLPTLKGKLSPKDEDWIIQHAFSLLEKRMFSHRGPAILQPDTATDYLRMQLLEEEREVFAVLFVDSQRKALAFERLFYGTLDATPVYPRVIVQRALLHNASSVILAHNHPSGETSPSEADKTLTQQVRAALKTVDIQVSDHIIIGQGQPFSFVQNGLFI